MKNAYFIPNISYKGMKKIDPLRVSQSISRNMIKDLNKETYGGEKDVPIDMKLKNRDQEILMGQDNDGDITPSDREATKKIKDMDIDKNEMVDIKDFKKQDTSKILNQKQG